MAKQSHDVIVLYTASLILSGMVVRGRFSNTRPVWAYSFLCWIMGLSFSDNGTASSCQATPLLGIQFLPSLGQYQLYWIRQSIFLGSRHRPYRPLKPEICLSAITSTACSHRVFQLLALSSRCAAGHSQILHKLENPHLCLVYHVQISRLSKWRPTLVLFPQLPFPLIFNSRSIQNGVS